MQHERVLYQAGAGQSTKKRVLGQLTVHTTEAQHSTETQSVRTPPRGGIGVLVSVMLWMSVSRWCQQHTDPLPPRAQKDLGKPCQLTQ